MKILITGSKGQMGEALTRRIPMIDPATELIKATRDDFDITNKNETVKSVADSGADIVINCAAYTKVDEAENEPDLAYSVNATGAGNVAEACALSSIRLVHISTDYVFDGKKSTPYMETDAPCPVGKYSISKADGEKNVVTYCPDALIIRTAWLFGYGGENFVSRILGKAREIKNLSVVDDQFGSPTFADDLADAIFHLVNVNAKGIYHVANSGFCSWHEFAVEAVRLSGLDSVTVNPKSSDDYQTLAPRPHNSRLSTSLFEKTTGEKLRHWKDALAKYIESNRF